VTVPAAALGETVAVRVTVAPAETEEFKSGESVVVVAMPLVPVPVPMGAFQKSPHPARRNASKEAKPAKGIAATGCIRFTVACLFLLPQRRCSLRAVYQG
jgi:hypothetical protein